MRVTVFRYFNFSNILSYIIIYLLWCHIVIWKKCRIRLHVGLAFLIFKLLLCCFVSWIQLGESCQFSVDTIEFLFSFGGFCGIFISSFIITVDLVKIWALLELWCTWLFNLFKKTNMLATDLPYWFDNLWNTISYSVLSSSGWYSFHLSHWLFWVVLLSDLLQLWLSLRTSLR